MALDRFYSGGSDPALQQDAIIKDPDLYIQKYEYIGEGVYAITTAGTSTLTPATSPSWNVNDYSSTVANNLMVVDGNGKICLGKVTSNTADAVTFDETAMLLEEDETTAGTFVAAATYSMWVLTPSAVTGRTYGPYMGYVDAINVSYTDEKAKYKSSTPRKTRFTDLIERVGEVSGGQIDIDNEDVLSALLGAEQYGSQTSQFSVGIGSNPNIDVFYRLTMAYEDRNSRAINRIIPMIQFSMNGNQLEKSESGHHLLPWVADIISHPGYPETADMGIYKRAD